MNTKHELLWHATSLDGNFLKRSLFMVACKTREYAIFSHTNGKFCTFFTLYKNVDMKDCHLSIKWETYPSRWRLWQNLRPFTVNSAFSYLAILKKCSFVDPAVFHWGYSKCKNAWFSYTFCFTFWVYVQF